MSEVSRRGLLTLRLREPAPQPDYETAARRVQDRWDAGAGRLLHALRPLAAAACDAADVDAGHTVLDVGAGNGNVALEAAGRGAAVCACDPAAPLLEAGRQRAGAEALAIEWRTAAARALPYADGRFDAVVSVLGAALDPRPRRSASELLRVLRPGGTLVLAVPGRRSLTARALRLGEALQPGVRSPLAWSEPAVAAERFPSCRLEVREAMFQLGLAPDQAAGALAGPLGVPSGSRGRLADIAAAHSEERWQLLVVRRGARAAPRRRDV